MDDIRFYLSVFLRRLPWFLVVATIIWAISFAVAMTLPPAYVSKMRLVVESPQIPEDLAASTVKTPALEQLQIIEQRLLTRDNLLALSRRFDVPPARDEMNPDEIVDAMRARTTIRMTSGRNEATMMTVSFEAANPRRAAAVLNEYLTLIQAADAQFRRGRSGETLDFFRQEVQRLDEELEAQSNRILEFKQKNAEALPESLEFRMSQRASLQERLSQNDREIGRLRNQRERLIQLFEATGGTDTDRPDRRVDRSPAQQQLLSLEAELTAALAVYSEENPKVKLLRNQIAQVSAQIEEERVQAVAAARTQSDSAEAGTDAAQGEETPDQARREMLNIQLSEIDGEINLLQTQQKTLTDEIAALDDTISRTPAVAIALDELQRAYDIIEAQYSSTEARLVAGADRRPDRNPVARAADFGHRTAQRAQRTDQAQPGENRRGRRRAGPSGGGGAGAVARGPEHLGPAARGSGQPLRNLAVHHHPVHPHTQADRPSARAQTTADPGDPSGNSRDDLRDARLLPADRPGGRKGDEQAWRALVSAHRKRRQD